MRGLLKNNFYASLPNVKIFSAVMILLGTAVVIKDNDGRSFIIGYMLLAMTGFSVISAAGLRKENASKWNQYKLTAPVRRGDIVKSYFLSLLLWLSVGMLFAGAAAGMSILLHGFPFDKNTDIFMVFVMGIGLSLFMGAIFFPLFYLGGEERAEVLIGLSLLCGIGLIMGASSLMNTLFGPRMTTFQIMLAGGIMLVFAVLVYLLSLPLTVHIFRKKC